MNSTAQQVKQPHMSLRVLLAEDEPRVQRFIKHGLEQVGMQVEAFDNFSDIDAALDTQSYDVLILDRLLHSEDAVYSIPKIRKKHPEQKIVVLSALSEAIQKVQGLDYGADDYIGKPFHMEELIARLKTLARRQISGQTERLNSRIQIYDLEIDLESQKVTREGRKIDLTLQEFKLLVALANKPEKVFTRSELLERVWDMSFDPGSNVVDVAMARLRRKINSVGAKKLISSKRGVGYSLENRHEDG